MKKLLMLAALCSPLLAQASDYTVSTGEEFRAVTRTPTGLGPGISFDHLKRDGGDKATSVGLSFGLPLGPLEVAPGVRAVYVEADGPLTAVQTGARISVALPEGLSLFGEGYVATPGMASGSVQKVSDQRGGIAWDAPGPFVVELGYRKFEVQRSDASRNRVLADGMYLGAGASF